MSSFASVRILLSLLLVFCFFSHYVCPARVTNLPGFHGRLPFHLETGYVTVDEENGSELFYYFFESEGNPIADPFLLWLTGGPLCTTFSAIAYEIGPVRFVLAPYNGSLPQLKYFPYSWTKVANILFVDSPVGSGFSFSLNPKGYEIGDISSSLQVHEFLMKWLTDHPQYLSNPLYIGGDSYAGKVVPFITHKISEGIEAGRIPVLNLKGYLVGNPVTGDPIDASSVIPYAHGLGIISDQIYEMTLRNCKGDDYSNPSNELCVQSLATVKELTSQIDDGNILAEVCTYAITIQDDNKRSRKLSNNKYTKLLKPPPRPPLSCTSYGPYLSYFWANNDITRNALGIKKGTVREWVRCNSDLPYIRDISSSIEYHRNLTTRGYRALVYSGDHDLVVPFLGTQAWVRSLNFSIVDDWRAWHVAGQPAGFTITYSNNMTYATVKGGAHTAPENRPKECLAMFTRWTANMPL